MDSINDITSHHRYISDTVDGIVTLLEEGSKFSNEELDEYINSKIAKFKFEIEAFLKVIGFRRLEIHYCPTDDGNYSSFKNHLYDTQEIMPDDIHVSLIIESSDCVHNDDMYAMCTFLTDDECCELVNRKPALVNIGNVYNPKSGDDEEYNNVLLDYITACVTLAKSYRKCMNNNPNDNILFMAFKHISNASNLVGDWSSGMIQKESNLMLAMNVDCWKNNNNNILSTCVGHSYLDQSDFDGADSDNTVSLFAGGIMNVCVKLFTEEEDIGASSVEIYIHDKKDDIGFVDGVPNYVKFVIKYVDNSDDKIGKVAVMYLCHNANKSPVMISNIMVLPKEVVTLLLSGVNALVSRLGVDSVDDIHLVADVIITSKVSEINLNDDIFNDKYFTVEEKLSDVLATIIPPKEDTK